MIRSIVNRYWRTHKDAFEDVWPEMEGMLEVMPELEAKTLFQFLQENNPGVFQDGQLRTFERRVSEWKAQNGPEKEVFFDHSDEMVERNLKESAEFAADASTGTIRAWSSAGNVADR